MGFDFESHTQVHLAFTVQTQNSMSDRSLLFNDSTIYKCERSRGHKTIKYIVLWALDFHFVQCTFIMKNILNTIIMNIFNLCAHIYQESNI